MAVRLTFSSLKNAAKMIRDGKITSLELTEHLVRRIEKHNPAINAIVTFTKEEALAQAKAADEAFSRGESLGPFHGVPITIKDCFEVADVRTTAGAEKLSEYVPKEDSATVSRLRGAGAVILGKTNVPVYAGDWQSYNEIFGTTSNPWDLDMTPGGSTGGGAAAVAAGLSFISLGSDIGGSIRVPSIFCGLYGHKPTIKILPYRGHIPRRHTPLLTVAGPIARCPEDLKLALEVMGGPDREEARAYSWALPTSRHGSLSEYKIGYVLDHPNCPLTKEVKEAVRVAVDKLRGEVSTLEEGWPQGVDPVKQYINYRFLHASVYASFLKDEEFNELKVRAKDQDGSHEAFMALGWTAPMKLYHKAMADRAKAQAAWQKFFEIHDVFLLPASFTTAFPHDHSEPQWQREIPTPEGPRTYEDIYFWITFATLTGLPATVAPIGSSSSGLPIGIQIIGPYLEDATPIDFATRTKRLFGGFKPPAGYEE
ncbi:MAG: amidase family protein [Candidatus Bathyarchaeota archaeon]|nr:amidase family protein [Candidatus Bathyarchaeota archaeon]